MIRQMLKSLFTGGIVLLGSLWATAENVECDPSQFHIGGATLDKKVEQSIKQAEVDYKAVMAGNKPVFAKRKSDDPISTDGGTMIYHGLGYSLKVLKSMTAVGSVNGLIYGPIITFDGNVVSGNSNVISHLQFYSGEEFRKVFHEK